MTTYELSSPLPTFSHQRGISLIELMIALVIGILVLTGVMQIFTGTSNTFRANDSLNRIQESGRFALEFMRRDLRMAGHMGCVNDRTHFAPGVQPTFFTTMISNAVDAELDDAPFRTHFHIALQGFEAKDTNVGDSLTLTNTPTIGAASDWEPELPADLTGLAGGMVASSDIVVVRYFSSEAVRSYGTPGHFNTPDAVNSRIEFRSGIHHPFPLRQGDTYAVADCMRALVFQASNFASNVMGVTQSGLNAQNFTATAGSFNQFREFFKAESVAFYVGIGTGGGHALFRATLQPSGNWLGEEIIEGVENMQLLYGSDERLADRPADFLTAEEVESLTGTQIENWRSIVSIKLGMIVRSPGNADTPAPADPFNVLGVNMTPPANSRQLRRAYESTFALRNRLRTL